MISAYHKANPIEPGLYEVFLIDLAMPNEFYQFVKEVVYDPVTFLNARTKNELAKMIQLQKSKRSVLAALSDWKVGKK
jgi:spore coat protein SA